MCHVDSLRYFPRKCFIFLRGFNTISWARKGEKNLWFPCCVTPVFQNAVGVDLKLCKQGWTSLIKAEKITAWRHVSIKTKVTYLNCHSCLLHVFFIYLLTTIWELTWKIIKTTFEINVNTVSTMHPKESNTLQTWAF